MKKEITINKSAISVAIKKGTLIVTDSGDVISEKTGEILEGITAEKNKILVMR